jgi:Na+-driven multidrug efflux pump
MWIIRLPLAYLMAIMLGLGAFGVWLAMVASMVVQGLLMAYRFQRGKWKTMEIM